MTQTVPQAALPLHDLNQGKAQDPDVASGQENVPVQADQNVDIGSFDDLYLRYKQSLTQYAIRQNASDPDGVADLALFDGYRALDRMRRYNEHTVRSYLYQAVRSHATEEGRKTHPIPTAIDDGNVSPFTGFESDLIDTMAVHAMLEQLPVDQRAVVEHRFIHGRTAKETGKLLGKKPNAVYQLQHRATRRLHRMILAGGIAILVVVAVMAARQADRQSVDSTPATPTETTEENSLSRDVPEGGVPLPGSDETDFVEREASRQAQQEPEAETAVIAGGDDADVPADVVSRSPITSPPADQGQPAQAQTLTEAPTEAPTDQTPPDTVVEAEPDTLPVDQQAEAPVPPTTEAVVPIQLIANNDIVQAVRGQAVTFNVVENDAPAGFIELVESVSGQVPGLTLTAEGDLTGVPAADPGSYIIVYRITGASGSTALGQIEIVVT